MNQDRTRKYFWWFENLPHTGLGPLVLDVEQNFNVVMERLSYLVIGDILNNDLLQGRRLV